MLGAPDDEHHDLDIGTELRKHRRARKWTQARLARAIGVSPQLIAKYERGECSISYRRLCTLTHILGLDLSFNPLTKGTLDASTTYTANPT